jgi:hypothetical protein
LAFLISERALRCCALPEVATVRIRSRRGTHSGATLTVAASMAADANDWPEPSTVHTTGSTESSLEQALDILRTWSGTAGIPQCRSPPPNRLAFADDAMRPTMTSRV